MRFLLQQAIAASGPKVEANKIPVFTGKESSTEANDWLDLVSRIFRACGNPSPTKRISTALTYFVKDAAQYVRRIETVWDEYRIWFCLYGHLTPGINNFPNASCACLTWADFVEDFSKNYINVDPKETAKDKLRALHMGKDQRADDFITEFKNLAGRTGYVASWST